MELTANGEVISNNRMKWQKDFNRESDSATWSDRLWEWDSKKYNEICQKVWGNTGQMFYDRKPKEIEQFLSLYYGEKIILTAIEQETNASNGYPYWIFYYRKG